MPGGAIGLLLAMLGCWRLTRETSEAPACKAIAFCVPCCWSRSIFFKARNYVYMFGFVCGSHLAVLRNHSWQGSGTKWDVGDQTPYQLRVKQAPYLLVLSLWPLSMIIFVLQHINHYRNRTIPSESWSFPLLNVRQMYLPPASSRTNIVKWNTTF